MSALQQQLATIQASSTHQLDLKAQKVAHSKSLLFEPKDAATQDFDTIYQICYEGFLELCTLDKMFTEFERTIFSEQSKSEERTQMNAKENVNLDAVLESFLGLVGSRLLLKPALKALEWLVRRFRVHEYNMDALLLAIMPYHTTQLFLTVLSILPRNISPTFKFLFPYITSLTNPPRHTVVYAATQNAPFFSALNNYVITVCKARHHSSTLLSFWAGVMVQAIDSMLDDSMSGRSSINNQRREDLLLRVLPVLDQGLAIKKVPDLTIACYMIITILVSKKNLGEQTVRSLMEAVLKSRISDTEVATLTCLAILSNELEPIGVPKSVTRGVLKTNELWKKLGIVAKQYPVGRLAISVAHGVLDDLSSSQLVRGLGLIEDLLEQSGMLLDAAETDLIIRLIVQAVDQVDHLDDVVRHLTDLLRRLASSPTLGSRVRTAIKALEIDVAALKIRLQTTLVDYQAPENEPEADSEMSGVGIPQLNETPYSQMLSELPAIIDAVSHLDPRIKRPQALDRCFLKAVGSATRLEQFLKTPLLDQSDVEGTLYISYFARFWCLPYPVNTRVAAVNVVINRLAEMDHHSALDFQGLLPYAIVALMDVDSKIRRAAATLIREIRKHYGVVEEHSKPPEGVKIWAKSTLYGASSHSLKWLESKQAIDILDRILVSTLEETVLDSSQIIRVLSAALNGSSFTNNSLGAVKSSSRTAFCNFLGGHISQTPLLAMQVKLLSILQRVGKHKNEAVQQDLSPLLQAWASRNGEDVENEARGASVELQDAEEVFAAIPTPLKKQVPAVLQCLARGTIGKGRGLLQKSAFKVIRTAYIEAKLETKLAIVEFLFSLAVPASNDQVSEIAQEQAVGVLRYISLSAGILEFLIGRLPTAGQMPDKPHSAKRRRTSKSEEVRIEAGDNKEISVAIQSITFVLELVEASEPERHCSLMKPLFDLLGEIQHFRSLMGSDLAYLQILALGNLAAIANNANIRTQDLDRGAVRADLLVDCIRSTSNPQVQNATLLVVSALAKRLPELVLHSVMPIFTFMGKSTLSQGDDYSTYVIHQTVQTVVPALANALRQNNHDLIEGVADLLLSFTTAYEHIPTQRRLPLFSLLVDTLEPNDCLYAVVAMLVDKYQEDFSVKAFVRELMRQQKPATQIDSVAKYIRTLLDSLGSNPRPSYKLLTFEGKSKAEADASIRNLLNTLVGLLGDQQLKLRVQRQLSRPNADNEALREAFSRALEHTMSLARTSLLPKRLQSLSGKVMDALLDVLPFEEFIESAKRLIQQDDDDLKQGLLKALDLRIRMDERRSSASRTAAIGFIQNLTSLINTSSDKSLKQVAVACLDQISEKYGKKDVTAVVQAAQCVASQECLGSSNGRLRVMSLLCLASMVEVSRDEFIPLLQSTLDLAVQSLVSSTNPDSIDAQLHDAALSFVVAVIANIPYMISGAYLEKILRNCHASAMVLPDAGAEASRMHFYDVAGMQLDAGVLFASVKNTFEGAARAGFKALREHVDLLRLAMNARPKSVVIKLSRSIFEIFLEALDLRRLRTVGNLNCSYQELGLIETLVNDAAIAMVMKMNDATFRPLFNQLVQWATSARSSNDTASRHARSTTFFIFLSTFFDKLKSLVTSYSSYILESTVDILQTVKLQETAARGLWEAIMLALSKSFEHDQDDFWQAPEHFNAIAAPLIAQVAHAREIPLKLTLIPTITALASAANAQEHHKEMNTAIMKHMRNEHAAIRLVAVQAEQDLTEKLGEEWLALLPEMLPFISELQEDDDEEVERETRAWIRKIEGLLGESLEGMLQ